MWDWVEEDEIIIREGTPIVPFGTSQGTKQENHAFVLPRLTLGGYFRWIVDYSI